MLEETKHQKKSEAFNLLAEMRVTVEDLRAFLDMKYAGDQEIIEKKMEKRYAILKRSRNQVMIAIQNTEPFLLN